MNKLKLVVFLSVCSSLPVWAANNGFYGGVNLGSGRMNVDSPNGVDQRSGFVGGVVGGYQFSKNIAAEAQLTTLGKMSDLAGGKVKANALSLTAVSTVPLNNEFSVYGKLGVAETRSIVTDGFPGENASRFALTGGVGAQYNAPASPVAFRLGWDRYGVATNDAVGNKVNSNANLVTVGAVYKF